MKTISISSIKTIPPGESAIANIIESNLMIPFPMQFIGISLAKTYISINNAIGSQNQIFKVGSICFKILTIEDTRFFICILLNL